MKRHRPKYGDHVNSERWLLTYADLITLLLGLFVILYAMSKIDTDKYANLVNAFGGMFGKERVSVTDSSVARVSADTAVNDTINEWETTERKIRAAMYQDLNGQLVSISRDKEGVRVHLTEELLFASGSAALKGSSLATLDLLAGVLLTLPNAIRIEGHTDDVPIRTHVYPSNWHLSVDRALITGFYLLEKHQLEPGKISIIGHSEFRPLVSNTTPENRARNRRVDIVIEVGNKTNGSYPSQQKKELPQ